MAASVTPVQPAGSSPRTPYPPFFLLGGVLRISRGCVGYHDMALDKKTPLLHANTVMRKHGRCLDLPVAGRTIMGNLPARNQELCERCTPAPP